jgi:hypothetical protein
MIFIKPNECNDIIAKAPWLTVEKIGVIWSILLISTGFLFPTYEISMPSTAIEFLRQIGISFLFAQAAIIAIAYHHGFKLRIMINRCSKPLAYLIVIFCSSFWISSIFVSQTPIYAILMCIGVLGSGPIKVLA